MAHWGDIEEQTPGVSGEVRGNFQGTAGCTAATGKWKLSFKKSFIIFKRFSWSDGFEGIKYIIKVEFKPENNFQLPSGRLLKNLTKTCQYDL